MITTAVAKLSMLCTFFGTYELHTRHACGIELFWEIWKELSVEKLYSKWYSCLCQYMFMQCLHKCSCIACIRWSPRIKTCMHTITSSLYFILCKTQHIMPSGLIETSIFKAFGILSTHKICTANSSNVSYVPCAYGIISILKLGHIVYVMVYIPCTYV